MLYNWLSTRLPLFQRTIQDLSKQQVLDADQKAMQQINFTGCADLPGVTAILFIIEEVNDTILDFPQEAVRVIYFDLIQY